MKRVLLTGADGFIGKHLELLLKNQGHHLAIATQPKFNLLDQNSVATFVESTSPEVVIHLAGMSHVIECENNKELAHQTNVSGTSFLLDALIMLNKPVHFIFASTAQVYKAPAQNETNLIISEDRPLQPQNYYASTKLESEKMILQATKDSKLGSTILRLFNHSHKSQAPIFFLPHIYHQLLSSAKTIPVGNLDLVRDIGSVHDLKYAFATLVRQASGTNEVFNVCSGHGKNLRTLANLLAKKMNVTAEFVLDANRVRNGEPKILIGSHKKLSAKTGWEPQILTEEQLVEDFLCE